MKCLEVWTRLKCLLWLVCTLGCQSHKCLPSSVARVTRRDHSSPKPGFSFPFFFNESQLNAIRINNKTANGAAVSHCRGWLFSGTACWNMHREKCFTFVLKTSLEWLFFCFCSYTSAKIMCVEFKYDTHTHSSILLLQNEPLCKGWHSWHLH